MIVKYDYIKNDYFKNKLYTYLTNQESVYYFNF
jgi:hypothetical protein